MFRPFVEHGVFPTHPTPALLDSLRPIDFLNLKF
jgi:hypothetical protein